MIIQNESKQSKMDSCVHKVLLRDIKTKTKNKDQPANNHKNDRKIKVMRSITPTMDQFSRNGYMEETNP